MSKLKVTTIADPDNDNTAISIDTSGNITIPNNATFSGTVSGISSGLLGMKYVRYTPASDRTLPNGDAITQLNITYTPVSSDSHIELSWNGAIFQSGSNHNLNIKFYRDTTALGTGQHVGGQNENNTYMYDVEQNLYVSEFATGHTAGTSYTWKVYTWAGDSAWQIKSDQTHRMIIKEWNGDLVTYAGENT